MADVLLFADFALAETNCPTVVLPAVGYTKLIQQKRYAFVCVAIKPGHHPVKRRGVTSVTKCHKCNGTGIIFIGKHHLPAFGR